MVIYDIYNHHDGKIKKYASNAIGASILLGLVNKDNIRNYSFNMETAEEIAIGIDTWYGNRMAYITKV